jgi:heptosyltransferase-3
METYLKDKADFAGIERVLVIKLQHLGDVLLASPVFSVLKQRFPHLEIDALIYADTAPVIADNPYISKLHCVDKKWKKTLTTQIKQETALFKTLKNRRYQLIIALTDRMRAAYLTRLLKPRYSVAQRYPYRRGEFWRNSFSHVYSIPTLPRHTVEAHLDALRRLGVYPHASEKQLTYPVTEAARRRVSLVLADHAVAAQGYIVLHPTSRWMFKSWSISGFAQVMRLLAAQSVTPVLVSGPDPKEQHYAETIYTESHHAGINLSGRLTLPELAALIAGARAFIGLDSVAMHIAAAVDTPCVALFGPTNEKTWGPWQVPHRIISADFTCRPCGLDGCGNGKISDCLQALSADRIIKAVKEIMRPSPA